MIWETHLEKAFRKCSGKVVDGQITCLEKQVKDALVFDLCACEFSNIERIQITFGEQRAINVRNGQTIALQEIYEKCWSPCLKPKIFEGVMIEEKLSNRNGIVDRFCTVRESEAVIPELDFREEPGAVETAAFAQNGVDAILDSSIQPGREVLFELLLRVAEHAGKFWTHGDVRQMIQLAEDGELCDFCHARQECEAQNGFCALDDLVE